MQLKLFMIRLDDDKPIPLDENFYSGITRDDDGGRNFFVTRTHLRGKDRRFYFPAFKIFLDDGETDEYTLAYSADGRNRKNFQRAGNFFYDPPKGHKIDEAALASTNPGVTYIHILRNGKSYGKPRRLLALPSSMSLLEYESMIREMILIQRELIQNSKSKSSLGEGFKPLCDANHWQKVLENLKSHVAELLTIMQRIDAHPRYGLRRTKKFLRPAQIRRFDEKILRQYVQMPSREKFCVSDAEISFDIFENRLLKRKLTDLKNFVENKSSRQRQIDFVTASNILYKIARYLKVNPNLPREEIISQWRQCVNEAKADNFLKKYEGPLQDYSQIISLDNQFSLNESNFETDSAHDEVMKNLEKCLSLKFFDEVDAAQEDWRMTQIFTNDTNYHRAYVKLHELDKIFDFSFAADEEKILLAKTEKIFEYWVLAKILEFLIVKQGWQAEDDENNHIKIFREFFSDFKSEEKFKNRPPIRLCHKAADSQMKLQIFYDTELKFSLGVKNWRRPDFLFKVTLGDATQIFILDAKYRNYSNMGKNFWQEKDLKEVCAEKYMAGLKDCGVEISAALIVHTDKSRSEDPSKILGEYVNFNALKNSYKQVGSFYLVPQICDEKFLNQSEENLTVFFQMIFEYYMRQWKICWQCGSENVQEDVLTTTGGKEKFYYTCRECGAFWVKTHCEKNSSHVIIKHFVNYHVSKDNSRWLFVCPICGD